MTDLEQKGFFTDKVEKETETIEEEVMAAEDKVDAEDNDNYDSIPSDAEPPRE